MKYFKIVIKPKTFAERTLKETVLFWRPANKSIFQQCTAKKATHAAVTIQGKNPMILYTPEKYV